LRLHSITTRIWLPFAGVLLILSLFVGIYYPTRQRALIEEHEQHELIELARTVALGIEISLDMNNFAGLQRSVDYISDRDDLDGVFVLADDSDDPIASMERSVTIGQLRALDPRFLAIEQPFLSEAFDGKVVIAINREKIDARVADINRPIYFILLFTLMLTTGVFYIVARQVSVPVLDAVNFARRLENGDYHVTISSKGKDEIGQLRRSLAELRDTLREQRDENIALTTGLEQTVRHRTAELSIALNDLYTAQRIGSMGNYSYFRNGYLKYSATLGELIGMDGEGAIHVDDLQDLLEEGEANLRRLLDGLTFDNPLTSVDIRLIPADGSGAKWLSLTAELMPPDEMHDEPRVSGTVQDISARKEAEEQLNQLSMVAKLTTNGVIITDVNKNIIWVNDALLKLTGYAWEEIIGRRPGMFQFEKTNADTARMISAELKEGRSVITEILNSSKSGREYWLELHIQPYMDVSGRLAGYLAVEIDITQRKADREALVSNLDALERSRNEIANINQQLEQRVEERTAQLSESLERVQKLQHELVNQERLASLGQLIAGIAHEINSPLGAITASGANLTYSLKQLLSSELQNVNPELLRTTCAFADSQRHTSMKSTVAQRAMVVEMKAQIQQHYGIGDEAARYARTLVDCGVTVQDSALLDSIFLNDPVAKSMEVTASILRTKVAIDTISIAAAQASTVIGAMKRQVHFDDSSERTEVALRHSIETVLILFRSQMKAGVRVELDIDEQLTVISHPGSLSQVWSNLISNAIQAMGGKGEISIYTLSENQHITVAMTNNGPMIPDDIRERIFEPFYTTKKIGEGTGMGLSIVREIVRTHGGDIWVESTPELTTFFIKLPARWT
jgi:PAS domain S-box-containing protein